MILSLSDRSSEPLHKQISRQVRAMILAGDLGIDQILPSIRGMAREQKVSVITVQRAYEDLEGENLIHTRRGKGFFVSQITDARRREMARVRFAKSFQPLLEIAVDEGLDFDQVRKLVETAIGEKRKGQ
jgi:GntR family transcriptional regulator